MDKTILSGNLERDIALIDNIFKKDDIIRKRRFFIGETNTECALFYIDGMINLTTLNEAVVKPILKANVADKNLNTELVLSRLLFASDAAGETDLGKMLSSLIYGDTLLLISGSKEAIIINSKGWRTRGISEPEDERILQGPREGFDEAAMLNLAMIRRRLLTTDLCFEMMKIGRRTNTLVFICYLDSLTDQKTLTLLKRRLKKIDIDGILDSNYIAEMIRDKKYSLLKTTGSTERPDIVAARLLEGRIALVVDGTPVVLTLPYLFSENFQSDEDYYINFLVSSVGRTLRFICFFLAVSVPAVFLSLITHHTGLLPTTFAVSVLRLSEGVPMPSVVECIILILVFEILKETGIRMPQSLGHALSIVGGLVVGQAAVEAGIVSAPMLIAVALSGISGLMVPRLKGIVFYLRIIAVIFSYFLGLYGFILVSSVFAIYVFTLTSFGVDYTVSLKNTSRQNLKDIFIRAPWFNMIKRPQFNKNKVRLGKND